MNQSISRDMVFDMYRFGSHTLYIRSSKFPLKRLAERHLLKIPKLQTEYVVGFGAHFKILCVCYQKVGEGTVIWCHRGRRAPVTSDSRITFSQIPQITFSFSSCTATKSKYLQKLILLLLPWLFLPVVLVSSVSYARFHFLTVGFEHLLTPFLRHGIIFAKRGVGFVMWTILCVLTVFS